MKFILKLVFVSLLALFFMLLMFFVLNPIFYAEHLIIPYAIYPFDICEKAPVAWHYIKLTYAITFTISSFLFSNSIFNLIFQNVKIKPKKPKHNYPKNELNLLIGKNTDTEEYVYIKEKSLFQNILITGTIGTGKTSSAMYPFVKQLIDYKCNSESEKLGMLILDVKGNFYKQVKDYAENSYRLDDLIVIELGSNITYNPLDKPHLKPSVLANRLKVILTLFSSNNSESYWLDKAEQVLTECIKLCRLYNNGYVTFVELHKLINSNDYYLQKISELRTIFQSGKLSKQNVYDLLSAITFFEEEFVKLDTRVLSILKSEITRITNLFVSDYEILNTFCPSKENLTFSGFSEVLQNGKIVVLNMNIAIYKNLSKIIAAYLKLDFQSEILSQLSNENVRKSVFICDEFHEYVTNTDADFFAQSREAKSINIVATQSYTSLLNTLKDQSNTKVIIQNLINKLWFRTDDTFTIEDAQKQIGKEEKTRISKSISENAQETNFNYFTNSLNSKNSSVSESISTYINYDFIYDTNFFTRELETFSCLSFLSDGNKILPPQKLEMFPCFKDSLSNNKQKYTEKR